MTGDEPTTGGSDDSPAAGSGDADETGNDQYVVREGAHAETYTSNEDAVERQQGYSIDPIGVGIALLIVLVAGYLLFIGPLSGLFAGPSAPEADWRVSRINDTHVQVAHVGGDDLQAENLVLTVDGTERDPGWPETVSGTTVVVVRADEPSTLILSWTGGGEPEQLARWDV